MTENKFFYQKKAEWNFMSFMVYGLYSFFLISPLAIFSKEFSLPLLPVLIVQFLIALLSLRMLLWMIFGKETVRVTETSLVIERTGTFFLSNKEIPLSHIRKFKLYKNRYEEELGEEGFRGAVTSFRGQFPIFKIRNVGRIIVLDKNFNEYRMLNGLMVEEGEFFIEKLSAFIPKNDHGKR